MFIIVLGCMFPVNPSSPFPKPSRFPAEDVKSIPRNIFIVVLLYASVKECCDFSLKSVNWAVWQLVV